MKSQSTQAKTRLLIVDDYESLRQLISSCLSGYRDIEVVGSVSGGHSAVRMTKQLMPDVVLMDVNMPDLNGVEATRMIVAEFPQVQVIGWSSDDSAVAMRAAGAVAFVLKGSSTEDLAATIRGASSLPHQQRKARNGEA